MFVTDISAPDTPYLSGYMVFQENDTLKLKAYYFVPLVVIIHSTWVVVPNTIQLGQITQSAGINYLTIYPFPTNSSSNDTTAFTQPDTTLAFPWVNSIGNTPTSEKSITLYPNPVTDELVISGLTDKSANITICDVTGRAVYQMNEASFTNHEYKVNVAVGRTDLSG